MKVNAILKANDTKDLKSLGAYCDVKSSFEKQIGLKLGVKGWDSFFVKVQELKLSVIRNRGDLNVIFESNSFRDVQSKILDILQLKVTATSQEDLKEKIEYLIKECNGEDFDPYKRFEETKMKNFKNSSRLEGIEIETPDESDTLEKIIAKYKR